MSSALLASSPVSSLLVFLMRPWLLSLLLSIFRVSKILLTFFLYSSSVPMPAADTITLFSILDFSENSLLTLAMRACVWSFGLLPLTLLIHDTVGPQDAFPLTSFSSVLKSWIKMSFAAHFVSSSTILRCNS
ncbi:hypothetical protein BpHYR1_026664 [Brachionus plicatilis]|uniref:Uncharacterized protein n=1 Tax=Brachionus plicatilis TaxID=10195 RepID=A0A3M7RUR2_BRAPC|nr:hypothetical protein BpHYR1_026664 [Brachionus plicatilis]